MDFLTIPLRLVYRGDEKTAGGGTLLVMHYGMSVWYFIHNQILFWNPANLELGGVK